MPTRPRHPLTCTHSHHDTQSTVLPAAQIVDEIQKLEYNAYRKLYNSNLHLGYGPRATRTSRPALCWGRPRRFGVLHSAYAQRGVCVAFEVNPIKKS